MATDSETDGSGGGKPAASSAPVIPPANPALTQTVTRGADGVTTKVATSNPKR